MSFLVGILRSSLLKKKTFTSSGDLWGLCTTPPATAAAAAAPPPPTPTPTAGVGASASDSATALSCSDVKLVSFGSPAMTPRTLSLSTAYLGRKVPLKLGSEGGTCYQSLATLSRVVETGRVYTWNLFVLHFWDSTLQGRRPFSFVCLKKKESAKIYSN